ncbi:FAD-dependent oxidoreductase [Pleurocapsales cyanobacterium LEGE 06147]|nr:FAD-dependent oxidoreductase [Pleurocapsales cyanobacterium LEGE 06147]
MIEKITTDVLVIGGGTGATAAAIQSARCGVKTVLVSEFPWLGGMLTAAGVSAPDGNELVAWQTGIWGAFLKALRQRQPGGLDNAWVSMFTYHPRLGAEIFADWARQLPNLQWISGYRPLEVLKQENRVEGVRFADFLVEAKITIDGTELGDLLALAEIPHRWGWELQAEFNEPSAPVSCNQLIDRYPIQAPTWVVILQDYGDSQASIISPSPSLPLSKSPFPDAWDNYGADKFLNYGRLPGELFMINWPIHGNDYGKKLGRLVESEASRKQFLQEAYWHSLDFACYIQSQLRKSYGLAKNIFPHGLGEGAFALHPYYRESRRLEGIVTVTEQDILPINNGYVAPLPLTAAGEVSAVAIGNYPNDHHYPEVEFPLQPKSIRWGGRWTGTPFTIPYGALVPKSTEGLLVCEKNISVSHIANGSTRLQPVVMNIGQAAGMAAALCIEFNCQPGELPVRKVQETLLTDKFAPAAVIPLFNLPPEHPDWLYWQRYYLEHPEEYPLDGNCPSSNYLVSGTNTGDLYRGIFQHNGEKFAPCRRGAAAPAKRDREYSITLTEPIARAGQAWQLITLHPEVARQFETWKQGQLVSVVGRCNISGGWLVAEMIVD